MGEKAGDGLSGSEPARFQAMRPTRLAIGVGGPMAASTTGEEMRPLKEELEEKAEEVWSESDTDIETEDEDEEQVSPKSAYSRGNSKVRESSKTSQSFRATIKDEHGSATAWG
jgi:hypothetical protein